MIRVIELARPCGVDPGPGDRPVDLVGVFAGRHDLTAVDPERDVAGTQDGAEQLHLV